MFQLKLDFFHNTFPTIFKYNPPVVIFIILMNTKLNLNKL